MACAEAEAGAPGTAHAAKTILFYRVFKRFAGHHLKVWHYFNHLLSSSEHTPFVWFSRDSLLDETNPWMQMPERVLRIRDELHADMFFLSGMDWHAFPEEERERSSRPVINLIQSVQHTWPEDPRSDLLKNKAIRICVTPEVAQLVENTGTVNGPVYTIPAAIDFDEVTAAAPQVERDVDLLIVGLKNPQLGRALEGRLRRPGRDVVLLDQLVPRLDFLALMRRARVTVFLPEPVEGLYMPALEGMALGTLVVCPDVYANRSFCVPDVNCFRPPYDEDSIRDAAETALSSASSAGEMLASAERTARERDLRRERAAFLEIVRDVDRIWSAQE